MLQPFKKTHETRINQLLTLYSKGQNNQIAFSQVMTLLVCQGILNKSVNFKSLHSIFIQSHNLPQTPTKKPPMKPQDPQKPPVVLQKMLSREQFVYFLDQLSKYLYHNNKKSVQLLFTEFLIDRNQLPIQERPRTPAIDQSTKKVLTQESVLQMVKYEQDIKACFDCYIWENYQAIKNKNRLLLQPKDITFQNKRMITAGLTLFIKQAEICPNFVSIEHMQDLVRSIVPPITQKQQHFYYKKLIIELYNDQLSKRNKPLIDVNDPGINFLEFQLILMRIAWDSYPKDFDKKGIDIIIEKFFDKIGLRNDMEKELGKHKKHLNLIQSYYKVYLGKSYVSPNLQQIQINTKQESQNKFKLELSGDDGFTLDTVQILKALDRVLPKLPPLPQTEKQKPHQVYDEKTPSVKINIGQQAPPEEKQQVKDAPKEAKKQVKLNKDEVPPRVFEWAPVPPEILSSEDYLKQLQMKLSTEIPHLSSLQRGTVQIQTYPSVISEIVFPTQIPQDSEQSLKNLRSSLVDKNFVLALENLQNAYTGWKKYCIRNSTQFLTEAQLFFQYSRGSIFCSAGQYARALNCFLNCRKFTEGGKMIFTNPDRSLPYMGMGEIFYEIQEYELSARSYLKAREIRQSLLKLQHVQTATAFCCLGACFFMLQRNMEALGYTEIAQNILASELGPYHQRTVTAKMNLKKIRRGEFNNFPNHRQLWQVYEKDQFQGGKKAKKVQKKKK